MTTPSPLQELQKQADTEFIRFGPTEDATSPRDETVPSVPIVSTYGEVEAEYAAIRKAAGLMELPHRATLCITGSERLDFLNRMVTNELKTCTPGDVVRTFWLSRKGRIQADLVLLERDEQMFADLNLASAPNAVSTLNEFLFTEDVEIVDATDSWHRLALHGPKAIMFLQAVCDGDNEQALNDLQPGRSILLSVQGHDVIVDRRETTGEVGLELLCAAEGVLTIHEQILEAGLGQGLRMIGWLAYNMARLEAGIPMYHVDFGPDSLPHETGLLPEAVSFTKGCYLGQEVVARMESRGGAAKRLVGLKIKGEFMPVTGSQVFNADDPVGDVVGAVTSAAPSPMLGNTMIAIAMMRNNRAEEGTRLLVHAEGHQAEAVVTPLPFWTH